MSKKETAMTKPEHANNSLVNLTDNFTEEELMNLQEATGLEDIPEEKRRLPLVVWNLDMTDESGQSVTKDKFYNMRTSEIFDEINCALVGIKQTRLFEERNKETGIKTRRCSSFDMITGDFQTDKGIVTRRCDKCEYRFAKQGQRKPCTIVQRLVSYDLDRGELFNFNAQRSSFVPISNYIEKNFFKKLTIGNKKMDIPLYMIKTNITLKEEQGVTRYYVLNPKNIGIMSDKGLILSLKDVAKKIKDMSQSEFEDETKQEKPNQENDTEENDSEDVPF